MKRKTTLMPGIAVVLSLTTATPANAQFNVSALVAGLTKTVGSNLTSAFTTATKAATNFVATHPGLVKTASHYAIKGAAMAAKAGVHHFAPGLAPHASGSPSSSSHSSSMPQKILKGLQSFSPKQSAPASDEPDQQ